MRSILFLTPNFGSIYGGVGASAERIVSYLRSQYDVIVIVPDRSLPPGTITTKFDSSGLKIQAFGPHNDQKLTNQFSAYIVIAEGRKSSIGAICTFYIGHLAYSGTFAASLLQIPLIACARGNDIDADIFGDQAFQIHHVLTRASIVSCVSTEMEAKVKSWNSNVKTKFIPNGVDEVHFPFLERESDSEKVVVGLFGEIKSKKGLALLLEGLDFKNFSLRIVGRLDDESAKLLHGFLNLNPDSEIQHVQFVKKHIELLEEYRKVDIVCIPSLYDGMPNVLLEAMSCGKVVVASEVGGALDVIKNGENGFLFPRGDSKALAEILLEAKDNLLGNIGFAARETVSKDFNWEKEMKAYLGLFE